MSHHIANMALALAQEKAQEKAHAQPVGKCLHNSPALLPAMWHGALSTNAGGVLVFNLTDKQTDFEVRIWDSDVLNATQLGSATHLDFSTATSKPSLLLIVHTDMSKNGKGVSLYLCKPQEGTENRKLLQHTPVPTPRAMEAAPPDNRTHWLSYDRAHLRIKYGKGYHMEETTEFTWELSKQLDPKEISYLFGNQVKMASFICLQGWSHATGGGVEDSRALIEFDRLPLTRNPPPKVKDSSILTLENLDDQDYTFSADLPGACQILYKNVAGASMLLDDELVKAIKYSIETDGMILNEKLKEKSKDFGYLRVTLGAELGDGPGIPYVLEIWPGCSKSPIHNHGNVCAVIKVLHGSIKVDVYNKLTEVVDHHKADPSREQAAKPLITNYPAPIAEVHLEKGDITWMDSNWYQCHQLINPAQERGDFCATIQCYKYDDQDRVVWPGFDYLSGTNHDNLVHLFKPDSDFTYGEMKSKVLDEYRKKLAGKRRRLA
ncbi:hypothetical protein Vafri_11823 [Volvox africanus]|uniref:Cysteine dioxygenase n=1 Tax=Volvox africanus TaxID=51714 RepID=A0A8J4B9U1_9CHLO|nr:hypothetical protein Vafri_11823 [Volvox africanus]